MEPAASTPSMPPPSGHQPGLHWGVKHRFLQYVARMRDGQCSVTDGATVDDTDRFHFALARTALTAEAVGVVTCHGDVRFAGHHGLLFVAVTDPVLHLEGNRGCLTIATAAERVHQSAGEVEHEGADRLVLAEFDLEPLLPPAGGSVRTYAGAAVRLSSDAVEVFNSVYPAGEPLDDFTLVLPDLDHPDSQETR